MPGLANRWLAKFVDDCWVVFDEAKKLLANPHVHQAGMPVRREIEDMNLSQNQDSKTFRILVFGGSQRRSAPNLLRAPTALNRRNVARGVAPTRAAAIR